MSVAEISWRMGDVLSVQIERLGLLTANNIPAPNSSQFGKNWVGDVTGIDVARYRQAADEILERRLTVLALENASLGSPPRWNYNLYSGETAPLVIGRTIDSFESCTRKCFRHNVGTYGAGILF